MTKAEILKDAFKKAKRKKQNIDVLVTTDHTDGFEHGLSMGEVVRITKVEKETVIIKQLEGSQEGMAARLEMSEFCLI